MKVLSEQACFAGTQGFYEHESGVIGLPMRFAVYMPPQSREAAVPLLFFLAGLTCSEETATIKAGAQRYAAERGLALVMPDTSPRRTGIAGVDAAWDFGDGAGFYLDATAEPWRERFRMASYLTTELLPLVAGRFAVDPARAGIFGHSMGGHGALTLGLKNPGLFKSVSAFAPIAAPMSCPWGVKAFSGYFGDTQEARALWAAHDATELVKAGRRVNGEILIDQGLADKFLAEQLHPHLFEAACQQAGQPVTVRRHEGYDHSYYFISTFMADHIAHHARALGAQS